MQLKKYQQNTLNILKQFFSECRIMEPKDAFEKIVSIPEVSDRLSNPKYVVSDSIPRVPRVCLKVPTGGGKTIIAAHAIRIISEIWLEREYPIVIWFTPSDPIRKQTAEALKNPRHPYRVALNEQFENVKIFDLDEKFQIRPSDIENNAVIIVATSQSFVKEDTAKYNVYRTNENLEPHFSKIKENEEMEFDENRKLKFSFANLLHHHTPLMIVDEAHKGLTELMDTTISRVNPSAIIELTATPKVGNNSLINNILYSVRASELKEEEMIKLPVVLTELKDWEPAVEEAIARQAELEKLANEEKDYIRPIVLFQAESQSKTNENRTTVEVLKNYLIETRGLPENQIKIATGDQKELDGIDLFNRNEPTRYIITVEALKEGWDCSFAYILCSLQNVKSSTSVEQLLGRVMRMPYARLRKNQSLNKAYAYVLSKTFGEAAEVLVHKLIEKGFNEDEAKSSVEYEQPKLIPDIDLSINKVKIEIEEGLFATTTTIPESIKFDSKNSVIEFTPSTTEEDITKLCKTVKPEDAKEIKTKFKYYRKQEDMPSPAKDGVTFTLPRLMVEIQGSLEFADSETIFEHYDWDISKFANNQLTDSEFKIERQGMDFEITLNGNKLQYNITSAHQTLIEYDDSDLHSSVHLISWLDKKLRQDDIPQSQMVNWLRQIVEYLTNTRKLKLADLFVAKYVLVAKLEDKINQAREKAKGQAYQESLFGEDKSRVEVDWDNGFKFGGNMYYDVAKYSGNFRFQKSFLGENKVPDFDGKEEFACAQIIDSLPEVNYWIRNVSRNPNSFKLPTSSDYFYPDFIVVLNDGRLLVIEYKGTHLKTTEDTKEKKLVGQLWEKQSDGKALFLMAFNDNNGMNIREQISQKIK